jgi:DNA-binding CsgD family transcriptional regulator
MDANSPGRPIVRPLIEPMAAPPRPWISPRERDVLERICAGDTTAELARAVGLAPSTVRWYVADLLRRTGCRNRAQLAAHAVRVGIIA